MRREEAGRARRGRTEQGQGGRKTEQGQCGGPRTHTDLLATEEMANPLVYPLAEHCLRAVAAVCAAPRHQRDVMQVG